MSKAHEIKVGDVLLVGAGKPAKIKVVNIIRLPWFQKGSVCIAFNNGKTDILPNELTVTKVTE